MANVKTLAFDEDQLWMLLDAMEGFDAAFHYDGDEKQIAKHDKIYRRMLKAYRKLHDENQLAK